MSDDEKHGFLIEYGNSSYKWQPINIIYYGSPPTDADESYWELWKWGGEHYHEVGLRDLKQRDKKIKDLCHIWVTTLRTVSFKTYLKSALPSAKVKVFREVRDVAEGMMSQK